VTSEITNKTVVAVTKLGDFWLTKAQADAMMQHKAADPDGNFELEGNCIGNRMIEGALTSEAYANLNIRRRGGWQCKYGNWHERNQQCAHGPRF